jgi:ABC-type bacteriocin/lantibiotic exporter with double-glycine peptidase domain
MDICFKFLSLLQVPFNNKSVRTFFNTHPHHPSILSISDLLDEFGIENAAIKIGKDNFSQIPTPFIAKTQSSEGDYCLVTQLDWKIHAN